MNKNLWYLIPVTIVAGVISYVTNKQNEKFREEEKRLVEETTSSLFAESEALLKEMHEINEQAGESIKEHKEWLNNHKKLNEEEAE